MLDVAKRPQDEDVRGPVDPGAFGDRGAPASDAALDGRAAPALEPVERILAVRLDEGVGDGVDKMGVRVHVVLPCENAAPARPGRSPRARTRARLPSAPLDSRGGGESGRRAAQGGDVRVPPVVERDGRVMRVGQLAPPTGRRISHRKFGARETTDGKEVGRPATVVFSVRRRLERTASSVKRWYRPHREESTTGAGEHALASDPDWSRDAYAARRTVDLYEVRRSLEIKWKQ